MNPTSTHEDAGSIPGHLSEVKDLALPWAVVRSGAAAAVVQAGSCRSIWPLAWEPPYASHVYGPKKQKKKKKNLPYLLWWHPPPEQFQFGVAQFEWFLFKYILKIFHMPQLNNPI